jgi:hypothetical protein
MPPGRATPSRLPCPRAPCRAADWSLVTAGATPEERLLNCSYVVSVARKVGAVIFCLPEDIAEVRARRTLAVYRHEL